MIAELKAILDTVNTVLSLLRKAKDFLPDSTARQEAERKIFEAEQMLKMAEVKSAEELGYHLCKCTWPPQIALSIGYKDYDEQFQCPRCKTIWPGDEGPPL
jgi:hypothetical protein